MNAPAARKAADLVGRHVGARQDRDDAGRRERLRCVDALDAAMRHRRTHNGGVKLVRAIDIVDILSAARNEAAVFLAPYSGADPVLSHNSPRSRQLPDRIASAPARMARTMFW